jgi:uncharacterized membrane protein HdeD (DUF308 family)
MVTGAAILLALVGIAVIAFGIYAMIHGGRDDSGGASGDKGGLGPISERGIHVLAGVRLVIFGLVCLAAAAFALTRF